MGLGEGKLYGRKENVKSDMIREQVFSDKLLPLFC